MRVSPINSPFIYALVTNIESNSDFKFECPYLAKVYELQIPALELPSVLTAAIMLVLNSKLCAEVKTFGVVRGQKNVNDFLSFGGVGYFNHT